MKHQLKVNVLMKLLIVAGSVISSCQAQRNASLPISSDSFRNILRTFTADKVTRRAKRSPDVPRGRQASTKDVRILLYGDSISEPTVYRYADIKGLLSDHNFDVNKPTVLYIHGYLETANDDSILTVVRAYRQNGSYNLLVLDWSNLAFGSYVNAILVLKQLGAQTGMAVAKLLKGGLPLKRLHVVGHSLGVHLGGDTCRYLKSIGFKVPRLTGLDPAYPGFYPAILGRPFSRNDAEFVDIIHTDGGGFGSPLATGHADFWPNEGNAKQPGCLPLTLLFTVEDFCSHWRSWRFWSESVEGGQFLARKCDDYNAFLRGRCREAPTVYMGLTANSELRGNFYLRTAAESPFALGERGAE